MKKRVSTMTPEQLRDIRQSMKKTQASLAHDLFLDVRTVQRMEAGKTPIHAAAARALLALLKAHTGDVPKKKRRA